ncbi:MAG TPA: hypothetical protein VHU87_07905 [Rhizomicrobium sp.]|nr:hypothetical protein [Rhizomicrobium sp.]
MASKGQMTGMLGVYLTAAELIRRGFIVSPTSRSAMGADLLVTDQECKKAWSVQVKTNGRNVNFWLTGKKAHKLISRSHVYVFVNAPQGEDARPRFYVVPSGIVARNVKGPPWYPYYRNEHYEGKWSVFGDPKGTKPAKLSRTKIS